MHRIKRWIRPEVVFHVIKLYFFFKFWDISSLYYHPFLQKKQFLYFEFSASCLFF